MKKEKKAFTLAEVLIVIGIIGVVAALTIPTLIKNHQKKVWVNQLKTSVVKIQDAFRLAMAEDGVEDLGETELWTSIPADVGLGSIYTESSGKPFFDNLSRYLKFNALKQQEFQYSAKALNFNSNQNMLGSITLLNGTTITSFSFYGNGYVKDNNFIKEEARLNGGAMWKKYGGFNIDVNGTKGPNQLGRDIFYFNIAQNGLLYPNNGKDDAIYSGGATIEDYKTNFWYYGADADPDLNCSTTSPSYGFGCAARVIEEGWKMNY